MAATYPKRTSHFANRFTRLLVKACVANEIGPDAVLLLIAVVHTEDAKGYRGPVTFWNGQLYPLVGCGSESSLKRVRTKCVNAGWLVYVPGAKGKAAAYWVTIPPGFGGWDDNPSDESPEEYRACHGAIESTGDLESVQNADGIRTECDLESGQHPDGMRTESGLHSSLRELVQEEPPSPPDVGVCESVSFHSHEPPPKILRFTEVVTAWNGIKGVASVQFPTDKQHRRFSERCFDQFFLDRWRDGIEAVRRSPRCCEGVSGWQATLGWFLTKGSLEELLNGEFDAVKKKSREPPREPAMDAAARDRLLNPPTAAPMDLKS